MENGKIEKLKNLKLSIWIDNNGSNHNLSELVQNKGQIR
jgi:hypothetical protein